MFGGGTRCLPHNVKQPAKGSFGGDHGIGHQQIGFVETVGVEH